MSKLKRRLASSVVLLMLVACLTPALAFAAENDEGQQDGLSAAQEQVAADAEMELASDDVSDADLPEASDDQQDTDAAAAEENDEVAAPEEEAAVEEEAAEAPMSYAAAAQSETTQDSTDIWLTWDESFTVHVDSLVVTAIPGYNFDNLFTLSTNGQNVTVKAKEWNDEYWDYYWYYRIGKAWLTINNVVYNLTLYMNAEFVPYDVSDDPNGVEIPGHTETMKVSDPNEFAILGMDIPGYAYQPEYEFPEDPSSSRWVNPGMMSEWVGSGANRVWRFILPFDKEEGDYHLDSSDGSEDLVYAFLGITDADGNPIVAQVVGGESGEIDFVVGTSYMTIDGIRVWCIEPEAGTSSGSAYFKRLATENLRAAFASIFGSDGDSLIAAFTNAYIWGAMGYIDAYNNPKRLDLSTLTLSDLTNEEQQRVNELFALIEGAVEAYESGKSPEFVSETDGVTVKGGELVIAKKADGSIPTQVVLRAQNPDMLKYYQYGYIKFADGITGKIDGDKVIINLSSNLNESGDLGIEFSMVPEDFQKETYEYYSNYGKQTLMSFGLEDSKSMTYRITFNEEPDEPKEPEEPTPDEPETPDEPKSEEPNEPAKPRESKPESITAQTGDDASALVFGMTGLALAGALIVLAASKRKNIA